MQARKAGQFALLNAYWVPLNFQTTALPTIAVPNLILRFRGVDHVAELALLATLVAVISMVAPPVAGEISDRLHRGGRPRRDIIVLGNLVNVVGLIWMVVARDANAFTAAVIVATIGQNVSGAAYAALIPEIVSPADWGLASGYQGVGTLIGSVAGLAVAGFVSSSMTIVISTIAIVAGVATVFWIAEGRYVESEHVEVHDWRNFGVAFASRFWTIFGVTLLNTFIFYFFSDAVRLSNAQAGTSYLGVTALLAALVSSVAMGALSDRLPRKFVVAAAGVPMAAAAIGFALLPELRWILAFAVLFGLGFGAFVATGWALAIDSVPALGSVARYMGMWGIASNLPAIFAPQAGAWILHAHHDALSGYRVLFIVSGISFLLGSAIVLCIRRKA